MKKKISLDTLFQCHTHGIESVCKISIILMTNRFVLNNERILISNDDFFNIEEVFDNARLQNLSSGTDNRHIIFLNKIRAYNNALVMTTSLCRGACEGSFMLIFKIAGTLYHQK